MEQSEFSDLQDKLDRLGFSSNEIKVLVHLYQNKEPQKADTISEFTGVPLTRVYETLDILVQKEFISIIQGRPRRYIPLQPSEALSSYLDQERKRMEEEMESTQRMVNDALDLVQNLYIQNHTQIEADELLLQFKSLEDAERQTLKILRDAKEEILIFTHVFQWFDKVKTALADAIARGCEVKILMQPNVKPVKTFREIDPIDIKELQDMGIRVRTIGSSEIMTRGTIVDRKYVVFVIWVDQPVANQKRLYRPQFSSNKGIVDVFYGYFQYLFQSSKEDSPK